MTEAGPQKFVFFGHSYCGSRFFRRTVLGPLAQINCYDIFRYRIQRHWIES